MRFVELALSALGPDRTALSSSAPTAITAAASGCLADAEITGIELDLDHIRRVETIAWAPIRPLACLTAYSRRLARPPSPHGWIR
jgi:hypothetical protein